MIRFESLTTAHIPTLHDYLKRFPRESCDYCIANLITWGKIYDNQIAMHEDKLLLFNPKYQYLLFPLGEDISPRYLVETVLSCREQYPDTQLILIPEDYILQHPDIHKYFDLSDDRDWADYVHSAERLIELRGKKLAKKKNLISQFKRLYPDYHVLKIEKHNADKIIAFTNKWKRERDVEGSFLDSESKAIANTLEHWDELPVEGIVICVDHKIYAYSIYSPLTDEMATVHYEKFDPDKKGSAQLINWETAKQLYPKYKWINREQDLGLSGLRQAKLSYDPDFLVSFITSQLKPIQGV